MSGLFLFFSSYLLYLILNSITRRMFEDILTTGLVLTVSDLRYFKTGKYPLV